ncbi:MAG: hypothetical protein ABSD29_25730, partial [Verrucomicrobiota bacterium]
IHSDEFTTIDLGSGREQVGVTQGRPGLNPAGTSAGTRLWKLTKPYSSNWLGLEAEVGIEPGSERSKTTPKPFGSGSFSNCCTAKDINGNEPLNQANNSQHSPTIPSASQHLWCPF